MSDGINQIIANSKKAREERQAAAEKRRQELAAKREAAFKPLYDRIQTARENVLAIQEDLADGIYKGSPIITPITAKISAPVPISISSVSSVSVSTSSPPPAPSATPATPTPPPPPPPPVKTAPIDTILFDDSSMSIEIMTDLIFEDIGGQEIISIVRNDTVNGQNIIYQPIKNLSLINQQYNPNNVLASQGTSDKYFENFIIKLSNKIPYEGNGPAGQNVYIDEDTADVVLDLINLEQDEQAEFQFRIDGTIYEAEL